jgi:hypothetical protein
MMSPEYQRDLLDQIAHKAREIMLLLDILKVDMPTPKLNKHVKRIKDKLQSWCDEDLAGLRKGMGL